MQQHYRHNEIHILERILYLLEERSVHHATKQDDAFADFIGGLYQTINRQAIELQTPDKTVA